MHLAILIVGILTIRLFLVLTHGNYLGVDAGAYLLGVNQVLGDEPTGVGFQRPLLGPGWTLAPFVLTLGADLGIKIWSALASILPVLSAYLLAGLFLKGRPRLFAAAFVGFDVLLAEMLVTGALPLIGFAMIGFAIWGIWKLSDPFEFSWRLIGGVALVLGLLAHVNFTTAGIAAVLLPVYFLALGYFSSERSEGSGSELEGFDGQPARLSLKMRAALAFLNYLSRSPAWFRIAVSPVSLFPITIAGLAGLVLALTALPTYFDVVPGGDKVAYQNGGSLIYLAHWPSDGIYFELFLAIPVALYLIARGSPFQLRAYGVVMVATGALAIFMSTDEAIINIFYRCRYLLPFLFWPAVTWTAVDLARRIPVGSMVRYSAVAAALFVAVMAYGFIWTFHNQAKYSDMITEESAEALELVAGQTGGIITNAFSMSHWVAGLYKVDSPHIWTLTPPPAYTARDEAVRCLLNWVAGCDPRAAAGQLGATHIIVDERFPFYNSRAPGNYKAPPDQWEWTAAAPWLRERFHEGTTTLWSIEL